ncbi:MAG: nucleotide exchange factor GrpE [Lachnospirales bacterium]
MDRELDKDEVLEKETPVNEENTSEEKNEEPKEEPKEPTIEEKLEEAEKKAQENYDKWLRQLAEFENFRKRSNAEKTGMYNSGVRDTIEKLLPVIDNFERAVDMAEDKESSTYKGVEMILKQFLEILASLGVEEIPALGEPFDPNYHSAIMHIDDESCDDNVIVEVFQKGYKHSDKVIRPSMVKVAN